ncbi:hypothetical protein B7486_13435 [cyanobacterium TDX16]|nr:hypothetical protein B7486_13435 [cyanobacterium TDX16]
MNPSKVGADSGQRRYSTKHTDIRWFRRGRSCLECGHEFLSAELPEEFVFELIRLRDALAGVKKHAEKYIAESEQAAVSLKDLGKSLGVLRALKIYKEA